MGEPEHGTATLAAEARIVCHHAGRPAPGNDTRRLPTAVAAAFARQLI